MEYKYKFRITQIVDEMGDLKPLGEYSCNTIPQQGDQIAILVSNEDGTPIQRVYLQVKYLVHFVSAGDIGIFTQNNNILGEIQCELLVEEGI